MRHSAFQLTEEKKRKRIILYMSASKLEIKIGAIEFSGEGDADWVAAQFDKLLEKAVNLSPAVGRGSHTAEQVVHSRTEHQPMAPDPDIGKKALGTFLRERNATEVNNKKFLAVAVWLEAKGSNRMKTGDVTTALRENNQNRLGNASQCLADNVKQGFCERDGDKFFVTQEGKDSIVK